MNRLKNTKGMTMAELLIVVAIIAVLGGVAFISIVSHQRSLGQLERDGIAKEIFVAAQNHLTVAHGQGYLGLADNNTCWIEDEYAKDESGEDIKGDSYVISGTNNPVLDMMLPFGSIDETIRAGGSYIIHYQKDTGTVLDVFYCTTSGKYSHAALTGEDYRQLITNYTGENHKKDYGGTIIGWYGGAEAAELAKVTIEAPTITVHNEEKLYVEVKYPNKKVKDSDEQDVAISVRLLIKGVTSGKEHYIDVINPGKIIDLTDSPLILDDITSQNGHFCNRTFDDLDGSVSNNYIPGENIIIQAVAFTNDTYGNIAYSAKNTTNSLFGSINSSMTTAYIGNIRHLENLDIAISKLDHDKINISSAEQTDSFSWTDFQKAIKNIEAKSSTSTIIEGDDETETTTQSTTDSTTVGVVDYEGNSTVKEGETKGYYKPINPTYALTYNGKSRSISDVEVDTTGNAGLFGSVTRVTEIKNLELIDFDIKGTTSAGALAGILEGCKVTNVLARNSESKSEAKIIATTNAGGLIGNLTNGAVWYSAAAVLVGDDTAKPANAGGLIGTAAGTITGCYSGGHTDHGEYYEHDENGRKKVTTTVDGVTTVNDSPIYNIKGTTAGGLVGSSSATISNSYSTCSVSGTTAGGLVGSARASITNCYATGLVNTSNISAKDDHITNNKKGAFAGELSGTISEYANCKYYRIINEIKLAETKNGEKTYTIDHYLGAVGDNKDSITGITPIDLNVESYNTFVGTFKEEREDVNGNVYYVGWNNARAYDAALVKYYSGKYTLKTIDELTQQSENDPPALASGYDNWNQLFVMVHYGDWPAPEVFFVNTSS